MAIRLQVLQRRLFKFPGRALVIARDAFQAAFPDPALISFLR